MVEADKKARLLLAERLAQIVDSFTHEAVEAALSQDDVGAIATLASPEAWSNPPDPLREARLRGATMRQEMLREAGGTLTIPNAAKALGVTPEAVRKKVKSRSLIGIPHGRNYLIPAIQIDNGALVRGLARTLRAMQVESPWMRLNWLLTPEPRLGDVRPIDWLKNGEDLAEILETAALEGEHSSD